MALRETLVAEQSAQLPVTVFSGVPSWQLRLFDRLKAITGKATIAEIWPTLRVVVHGGKVIVATCNLEGPFARKETAIVCIGGK